MNGAKPAEVLSFLAENGLGDNIGEGRVARAAQRLVNEGKMIEKKGRYMLTESGTTEAGQAVNLLAQTAPLEAATRPQGAAVTTPEGGRMEP